MVGVGPAWPPGTAVAVALGLAVPANAHADGTLFDLKPYEELGCSGLSSLSNLIQREILFDRSIQQYIVAIKLGVAAITIEIELGFAAR